MTPDEIKLLPDYLHEIDRNKLRFNGTGPRLHDRPEKLWPRDYIDPENEAQKVLYPALKRLIDSEQKIQSIQSIIEQIFYGLRQCNTTKLFNKSCPLDHGYFNRVQFSVSHAMEAYTSYDKIISFIHQSLRSINIGQKGKNFIKVIFGCHCNYDIFKLHIKWLVIGNLKLRKMIIGQFVLFDGLSMDLTKVKWLRGLTTKAQYSIFIQVIYALTRFISELLRRYFYITVSNPYANKLFYYRYDLWQKLHSIVINSYIDTNLLYKFEISDGIDLPPNGTSKLKFYLKRDNLRLICTKQRGPKNSEVMLHQLRAVLTYILNRIPNYEKFTLTSLLNGLKELRRKSSNEGKKIYFVRADIENCFQNIKQEKLKRIITDNLYNHRKSGYFELVKLSCTTKHDQQRRGTREIIRWSIDPQSVKMSGDFDHVQVVNSKYINIEEFDRVYLRPQIVNPVLRESKTSKNGYNLLVGIRQGSPFSPLLCAIYIQEAFNKYLGDLLNVNDCKLFRYVDDILFMTTDLVKAQKFMDRMLKGLEEFGLRSNANKLACNFECEGIDEGVCRLDEFVLFYKRKISLSTLHCTYNYSYNSISIDNTFHVSPYFNQESVYNSVFKLSRIEAIHLDYELNGIYCVIENIFENALLTAFRMATLLITSFTFRNLNNQQEKFIMKVVNQIARRIMSCIESGLRRKVIENKLTFKEVRLLTLAAFLVTWRGNRLRHRTNELYELERFMRRYMMKYLVSTDADIETLDELRGVKFEEMIYKLIKKFPNSSFPKEVILPSK